MRGILIEDGDIVVVNGKLALGDISEQTAEFLCIAAPGDFKETPMLGLNVTLMLNGTIDEFFTNRLRNQLASQHLKAKKITLSNDNIDIEL